LSAKSASFEEIKLQNEQFGFASLRLCEKMKALLARPYGSRKPIKTAKTSDHPQKTPKSAEKHLA
jgi:hypothetical protein